MAFPRMDRRRLFRAALFSAAALFVLVIAGVVWVYSQAVGRFEVRRVALPTRVFSDLIPLEPATALDQKGVVAHLERLGYREGAELEGPGTYFIATPETLRVHLRPYDYRDGRRPPKLVRIIFKDGSIAAVVSESDGSNLTGAAIEPELLASLVGDSLESRSPVTLDHVPPHLIEAVIATEDVMFWQHPGIDPVGITRALFRNLRAKGVAQGGSTLTQQLVKNHYLGHERTLRRKVVEAFMSLILDSKYTKNEILESYLNDIYLGRDRSISVIGVGEAARFYFGKDVKEITLGESAMIAGLIRSPNNNSPFVNRARAERRRTTVLGLMLKQEMITPQQFEFAKAEPIPEAPSIDTSGLSSIPYYVERALDELHREYGIRRVQGRGLSIYTAIDLAWQNEAAQSLEAGLRVLEKRSPRIRKADPPLEGVIIGVDVASAEIRALVGGRDYQRSQFNRAVRAKRQVGSLFKPIAVLAAFEPSLSGVTITPATLVDDSRFALQRRFVGDWSPRNYDGTYRGVVTVRTALEQSLNAASVRIGMAAGLDAVVRAARAIGIEEKLEPMPSMILGAVGLTPVEMSDAYTTIARLGSRLPVHAVRFVTDDRGRVMKGTAWSAPVQVFPQRDVYLLVHIMEGVMRRGTGGSSRRLFRKTAAGKTGTTNDKRDAWCIGFTPQTLALTWIGFDNNIPVGLSSSDAAVPVWTRYMSAIATDVPAAEFPVPPAMKFLWIDSVSGLRSGRFCPPRGNVREAFKEGTEPKAFCTLHPAPPPELLVEVPVAEAGVDAGGVPDEATPAVPAAPEPAPTPSPAPLSP